MVNILRYPDIMKTIFSKMRILAHNLNIETGRFYNLDRHERECV
jgi:hypothetical protein